MKIITIIGARPQFVKAAAVSRAIARHNAVSHNPHSTIKEIMVHTGQHFDSNMSNVFFAELGIAEPVYNLDINGGTHGDMTGRMLIEIEKILSHEKPDWVLVYGDTNSTLAGALAAVKMHIPVAHVEAGLRSFNMAMPEEINRILTDRISSILFCPTETAVKNLLHEGFPLPLTDNTAPVTYPLVINVGDVMYDVALHYGTNINDQDGILGKLSVSYGVSLGTYCLATIHRAENTDHLERLKNIFTALCEFSTEIPVILPIHPRTRKIFESSGVLTSSPLPRTFLLIDPVGYLDMVRLEKHAALIATDSGGVQKEAFFYQVPCVTLRDETEWVELVESGWNRLAPPVSSVSLVSALRSTLGKQGERVQPYGDGKASGKIVAALVRGVV